MVINTGTTQIHLKFNSIDEKREWYFSIIEC